MKVSDRWLGIGCHRIHSHLIYLSYFKIYKGVKFVVVNSPFGAGLMDQCSLAFFEPFTFLLLVGNPLPSFYWWVGKGLVSLASTTWNLHYIIKLYGSM